MTATISHFAHPWAVSNAPVVRRRITPQAGHALEKLGHAIEYLSDELIVAPQDSKGCMQAILLLMEVNRSVYADCPEVPSFSQRLTAMLRRVA